MKQYQSKTQKESKVFFLGGGWRVGDGEERVEFTDM